MKGGRLHRSRPVSRRVAPAGLLALAALTLGAGPASDRVVLLESESYGCGAAPGLGCGLAIAPVLAALDTLPGVAKSSVSWDGRWFRIELLDAADGDEVAASVVEVLEGEERLVESTPASPEPERWYDASGTVELSRFEAGVIAESLTAEIVTRTELSDAEQERVRDLLREALEGAFLRAHEAGGGTHRLWEQAPRACEEFERDLGFLGAEQRAVIAAYLDERLGA